MKNLILCLVAFASVVTSLPEASAQGISKILYINRCKNGCTVRRGADDAPAMTSTIPDGGNEFFLNEFTNAAGEPGLAADAEWEALMTCIREVYSPYDIQITDVKPTAPQYSMTLVAGRSVDIGLQGANGVGLSAACTPLNNTISYVFANQIRMQGDARTWYLCLAAAQESGHSFGLDHAWAHADGRSACNDPMTYRDDCGGQRFFRNNQQTCGEYSERPCRCGGLQNPHQRLVNIFGPGQSLVPAPTLEVELPKAGMPVGTGVKATSFSQRGVDKIELWINGYKWGEARGASFGPNGQAESVYGIPYKAEIPDGVWDVIIKSMDDIGTTTESPVITVTRGEPCDDAATDCAAGQKCDAGKCYWEPPTGVLGDECSYAQFCESELCTAPEGKQDVCTRTCVTGIEGACEDGYECVATSATQGFCYPASNTGGGGGCSVQGGDTRGSLAGFSLAMFGAAFVIRRRRR